MKAIGISHPARKRIFVAGAVLWIVSAATAVEATPRMVLGELFTAEL